MEERNDYVAQPSQAADPITEQPQSPPPAEAPKLAEEPKAEEQKAPVNVCDVQFRPGSKIYYFDPNRLPLKVGDHVIIDTSRGAEFGYCTASSHRVPAREVVAPLRKVLRIADEQDERIHSDNQAKEKKAYTVCLQKIEELKLDMQLVSAECAFDGSKILLFFTADGRVDFRELVKSLASVFHTRIELRQIGVRDKARMVGGLGICGRPFCCAQFLEDFQPVSIKMAKTQNLSLNSAKISGTCGRLMCCLKYEQDAYEDMLRTSPKPESFVDTPDGRGTVTDVSLLKQSVKVRMEDSPQTFNCYHNCDICVLRNGKAKKTDPPIPTDLAPISGNRERKPVETTPRFERRRPVAPILHEPVAEPILAPKQPIIAPKQPIAAPIEPKGESASRNRRRRGGKGRAKPAEIVPKSSTPLKRPPEPKKEPQAAASAEGAPKPKSKNRRYYHRKPKSGT